MLSKTQIRYLKSLSNTLDHKYQIGKYEITDTVVDMLSHALDKHELIKISVNQSVMEQRNEYAEELVNALHAELIQIVGGVITLYRKNLKDPKIKLTRLKRKYYYLEDLLILFIMLILNLLCKHITN